MPAPPRIRSTRRVATYSIVANVASKSDAIPISRSKTRIAIEVAQPMKSGPRYFRFARSDHGFAAAITSAVSARYPAMKSTMKSLISSTGSYCTGPTRIHNFAPLTSWPNTATSTNNTIEPRTQTYLYADSRRNVSNEEPSAITSASDIKSQSSCLCARSLEMRAMVARPSADTRTASAGNTSSRRTSSGARTTHTSVASTSVTSSHGGPIAPRGASDKAKPPTARAHAVGKTRLRSFRARVTSGMAGKPGAQHVRAYADHG